MKYKTAKVVSHPRAGSHYFSHLLNINFFNMPDYLPLYGGHSDSHKIHLKNKNIAVFYVYRNNEDTIKSMYNMRNRLGLVAKNLDEFRNKKLSKMHSTNIQSSTVRRTGKTQKLVTQVDTYLANFDLRVEDYLNKHKESWLNIKQDNFMPVAYEDLSHNFEDIMWEVSMFLGEEKVSFMEETHRMGWYDISEPKKNFS